VRNVTSKGVLFNVDKHEKWDLWCDISLSKTEERERRGSETAEEADKTATWCDNVDIFCFGGEAQREFAASMLNCKDGENRLIRNVVTCSLKNTASQPTRQQYS
jgi:hypothetical protein